MTRKPLAIVAVLLSTSSLLAFDNVKLNGIDSIVKARISKGGEFPGAVIIVIHNDEVVYRKAFGHRALEPVKEAMTADTIFDLASVTKPMATGTSIHKLIEEGKLKVSDPVAKYWPEFAANGKEKVTIEHCLLHTSGLTADNSIKDYANGQEEAIKAIAGLKLEAEPGTRFRYSDVGFMVLGAVVAKISGEPVGKFAARSVFKPLGMKDSGYSLDQQDRIAPTGKRDGKVIRGVVHDPRAFRLSEGFAGHAGLFSSADDLARYCRMMLRGGELDGVRILSPESVRRFTEPHKVPGGMRSYGWDVSTGFSGQRGSLFPAGDGYGHTGFTGTSIWIDPPSKTAIIILTNRVHPNDKGNASPLRREVATLVASATDGIAARKKPVKTGADLLVESNFAALKGKKVGLVTNHTGRTSNGISLVDALAQSSECKLVALFSPEHGIRGEKDEKVGDGKDEKTGLPIWSLYGERRKPTAETLKGIDVLVYDLQDIGCRFYTFISTLGLVMEAAKEHGVEVVVLDRPNPVGGVAVEGPMLEEGHSDFVGFHSLPLRHGLTVGELAMMFNKERKLNIPLTVIKCEGWNRSDLWDATNLPWRNPSPNMRHLTAAMLYPGVGVIEFTNVSVGRGTERPFEWIGAPWIDSREFARSLNAKAVPGVRFVPTMRTPISSVHKDKTCGGVDIIITDWASVKPMAVGLAIITTLRDLYSKDWITKRLNRLLLHRASLALLEAGKSAAEIEASWQAGLEVYRERRRPFLLYGE